MGCLVQILFVLHVSSIAVSAEEFRDGNAPGDYSASTDWSNIGEFLDSAPISALPPLLRGSGQLDAGGSGPEESRRLPTVNPYSALDLIESVEPFLVNFSSAAPKPQPGPRSSPVSSDDAKYTPKPKIKFRNDTDQEAGLLISWVAITPDGSGHKYSLRRTDETLSALIAFGNLSFPPFAGAEGPIRPLGGIIGRDDRRRISLQQVSQFPYRTIGQLEYNFGGKSYICSAALYGPRHVLTAAHCLYDQESRTWHTDVKFFVGRYDRNTYRGRSTWSKAYVHWGYVDGGFAEDDMAVIILSKNLGNQLGWLGFTPKDSLGQPMHTTGYPGDKSAGTMWHTSCKVIRGKYDIPRVLWHDCDTVKGQSGSAMYSMSYYTMATLVGWKGEQNVTCDITNDRFWWLRSFL